MSTQYSHSSIITCIFLLTFSHSASESSSTVDKPMPSDPNFSYGVPSTFHLANDVQKALLQDIADKEFTLDHLSVNDQALLSDALQYSGIELGNHCEIEKQATTFIKAFFRKYNESEHKHFDPEKGMLDLLPKAEKDQPPPEPSWQPLKSDYHEYPYPISEELVIPKTVAVDLSSIQSISRTDTTASFQADPSRLLYAKLPPDEPLWDLLKMIVEFDVDLNTRRVTNQTLKIEKSTRVFFGIRVTKFELHYHFTDNEKIDRNVMNHMTQLMRGRMYLLASAQFEIEGDYSVGECTENLPTKSYLYQSIDSIKQLSL